MANLLSTSITGTATTSGSVVIGGTFANNPYNSVSSTRLMFGGGDAPNNYSIGTSLQDYGGNYTKFDIRWHTGIRMGAQPSYGGIRFFSDETLATRIMSIGETDANVRIDNNLYIGSHFYGSYNQSNILLKTAGNAGEGGILLQSSAGSFRFQIYGNGTDYGFLNGNWAGWDIRKAISGAMYMNNDNSYYLQTNSTSNFLALNIQGSAVIHAGNIGSQSVNYATSAGSVDGLTLTSSANNLNPDNVTQNQIGYNTSVSLFGQTDGGLYSSAYSSSWIHQIFGDFRTGQIAIRGKSSNEWGDWRIVVDDRNIASYAVPYGDMTGSTGLNDNKLYLRTNGDNNHYLWNAADDWEELVYYTGTGFRVKGSTGTVSATFTDSGINLPSGSVAQFYTAAGSLRGYIQATDTDDNHFIIATSGGEDIVFKDGGLDGSRNMVIRGNASVEAYGDFRAPIFYDSADTNYYLDPASYSRLSRVHPKNLGGATLNEYSTNVGVAGSGNWERTAFIDGMEVLAHVSTGNGNAQTCYNWFTTENVSVDPNKDYEFSVWVKSDGNDSVYFGWHEFNSSGTVVTANPYFHGGGINTGGTWVKLTARLKGWQTTSNEPDAEGTDRRPSVYSFLSGLPGNAGTTDGVMHSNTVQVHMRCGTCYGSVDGSKTYFYSPRIREATYDEVQNHIVLPYYNGSDWTGKLRLGYNDWGYYGIGMYGAAGEFRMSSDSGDLNLRVDGWIIGYNYVQSTSAMYSPIYYDGNDNTYYLDPDSNSRLVNLGLGGATPDVRLSVSGDIHTDGYIYQGGTAGNLNSWGSRTFVNSGNYTSNARSFTFDNVGFGSTWTFAISSDGGVTTSRHIDSNTVWTNDATALFLGWYSGKVVLGNNNNGNHDPAAALGGNTVAVTNPLYSFTSTYSPIYYDSEDTAYYVDPNATSNILASYIGRVLINHDGTDTWFRMQSGNRMRITTTGGTDFIIPNEGEMSYNGNTVIHSGNIGSQSVSYADSAGSAPNSGNINPFYNVTAGDGNGLRFWGGSDSYKISMGVGSLYQYGTVSDYSIKMQMNDSSTGRGFTWGRISYAPIASLNSTSGDFQVAGTIANGSIWINNGANNNDYNENIRLFNAPNGVSVIAFSASGTGGTPATSLLGYSDRFETRVSDTWEQRIYAGYVEARGSFRAPVFYDSSDTTYYLDPNSTTKSLNIAGNIDLIARSATWAEGIRIRVPSTSTWGGIRLTRDRGNYDGNWAIGYTGTNASDDLTFWAENGGDGGSMKLQMDKAGNSTFQTSVRAPIFYDSNDTTYYLDPANSSLSLNVAGYTKSKFTYRNNSSAGLPGQDYPVKTATGVLATLSSGGGGSEYIIIKTRVPQDSYQMGGFTIDLFARYGDSNAKTTISLGGYWNAESNSGFTGWEYNTTNPNVRPDIQVMRDVTDGSTCFAIQISKSYPIVVARDLYLGYNSSDIEGWLDWSIFGADDLGGYTNGDTVVCRNALPADQWYGNSRIQYDGGYYGTIFYDSADTNYYLDPNSTSRLHIIKLSTDQWNQSSDGYNRFYFGNNARTYFGSGNGYEFRSAADANIASISNAGDFVAAGDVTAYSDARIKENVHTIENALDKTLQLRGVTYNRTDSEDKSTKVGVIAQEILEVIPEVVKQNDEGMYSVSYGNLTAVLIEAIKEQQKQIDELKEIINGLTK